MPDLLLAMQIPGWATDLIRAGAVVAGALVLSWAIRRRVRRWAEQHPADTADLLRLRRRETAAALLMSVTRYTLWLVVVAVLLTIFLRTSITAAAGASLAAVLIGFGAQRFLQDVIAGFFILAEGQYGVGDFVTIDPMKASGVVDELGLRTTGAPQPERGPQRHPERTDQRRAPVAERLPEVHRRAAHDRGRDRPLDARRRARRVAGRGTPASCSGPSSRRSTTSARA